MAFGLRSGRIFRGLLAALAVLGAALGCGPEFPPFWLIEADPLSEGGEIDPAGKLRILGLRADPPEGPPGTAVTVRALVVTHPQQGQLGLIEKESVHTPQPIGLSAVWFACRAADSAVAPDPCGLGADFGSSSLDLEELPVGAPTDADGPSTHLTLPAGPALPYSRIVTLVVADGSYAGGAQACYAQAVQNGGVSSSPNHCVIAIKRLRVSMDANPNHNPGIANLYFGASDDALVNTETAATSYPLLDPATSDDDRPKLVLSVERASDAIEMGSDSDGTPRAEMLTSSFFTTAGTFDAGRGSFLDLSCADDPVNCPQLPRSEVAWQPPAALAARETPEQWVFFFVVVRDDRGGLSYAKATVHGH